MLPVTCGECICVTGCQGNIFCVRFMHCDKVSRVKDSQHGVLLGSFQPLGWYGAKLNNWTVILKRKCLPNINGFSRAQDSNWQEKPLISTRQFETGTLS